MTKIVALLYEFHGNNFTICSILNFNMKDNTQIVFYKEVHLLFHELNYIIACGLVNFLSL